MGVQHSAGTRPLWAPLGGGTVEKTWRPSQRPAQAINVLCTVDEKGYWSATFAVCRPSDLGPIVTRTHYSSLTSSELADVIDVMVAQGLDHI